VASDELNRIQARRATLYHATLNLEQAVGSPTGDLGTWRARTLSAVHELRERIVDHKRQTEEPGEFLDMIAQQAPHLVNAAKKLEAEHDDLIVHATQLHDMIERLRPTDETSAAGAIRQSALRLMGRLVNHRQQGADLVYLAYNEDLGSAG
jgi:non-homologous end joining protein Ku